MNKGQIIQVFAFVAMIVVLTIVVFIAAID